MPSYQIIVVKTGRSNFECHNFFIHTPIEVILVSLDRYQCVEIETEGATLRNKMFTPFNMIWCLKILFEGFIM